MQCPRCFTENEPSAVFCKNCKLVLSDVADGNVTANENVNLQNPSEGGPEIASPVICPNCGNYNRPTSKYCGRCGTSLVAQPTMPPPDAAVSARLKAERFSVGMFVHMLIGGVLTVLFYLAIWPVSSHIVFVKKFIVNGWTPYAAVFLFFWSLSMMVGKMFHVRQLRKCQSVTYIPNDARLDTDAGIAGAITAVRSTTKSQKDNTLGYRIQRILEHFRTSRSIKEASDVMLEESDSDFAALESSYTLVRVFLWTIPILGFIGTVTGVGSAVGKFATFLSAARDIENVNQIKEALTGVTKDLSLAFETTLVALLLSVIVMVIMSAVEKREKDQLRYFDTYCQDYVLRRLPTQSAAQGNGTEITDHVSFDFDAMRAQLVNTLASTFISWQNQMTQAVLNSLSTSWEAAGKKWQDGIAESYARQQNTLLETWKEVSQDWEQKATESYKKQQESLDKISSERQSLQGEARNLISNMTNVVKAEQDGIKEIMGAAAETVNKQHNMVQSYVGALQRTAGKLEELIELQNKLETGLLQAAGSDGLAAVLKDVRGTLQVLDPALHKLTDKPIDVNITFSAGTPTASVGR